MNLAWTRTPPTSDGFYFFLAGGEVHVCEVSHDPEAEPTTPADERFMVEYIGDPEAYFAHDQEGE